MVQVEQRTSTGELPSLTPEQVAEGYSVVRNQAGYVEVWHGKLQLALYAMTPDLGARVQTIMENRRRHLREGGQPVKA